LSTFLDRYYYIFDFAAPFQLNFRLEDVTFDLQFIDASSSTYKNFVAFIERQVRESSNFWSKFNLNSLNPVILFVHKMPQSLKAKYNKQ